MSKVFMLIHTEPPVIKCVNPVTSNIIQDAHNIKFYYRGGRGIVLLEKETEKGFNVYVPSFSALTKDGIHEKLNKPEIEKAIDEQMAVCEVQLFNWFLFDIDTKMILTSESFIDFIPYYGIDKSVFVIENEDGSFEPGCRYLSNQSPYGIMQFLPLVIAKKELIYPARQSSWSNAGKKILSYLVSEKHGHPGEYKYQTGHWDSVTYMIKQSKTRTTPIDLTRLNTNKILEISRTLCIGDEIIEGAMSEEDLDMYADWHRMRRFEGSAGMSAGRVGSIILLTHLLDSGVERFFQGDYHEMIDVELDTQRDVFKSISIDPPSGLVFVETVPGVEYTLERIKEMLQTERVQLLNELL